MCFCTCAHPWLRPHLRPPSSPGMATPVAATPRHLVGGAAAAPGGAQHRASETRLYWASTFKCAQLLTGFRQVFMKNKTYQELNKKEIVFFFPPTLRSVLGANRGGAVTPRSAWGQL